MSNFLCSLKLKRANFILPFAGGRSVTSRGSVICVLSNAASPAIEKPLQVS